MEIHPFFIFAAILIVIWTLSGIASWIAKQQEAERRRRAAMQIRGQTPPPLHPQSMPPPTLHQQPRHISEGIAERFPEVLRPPAQTPQRRPRVQAPQRIPAPISPTRRAPASQRPAKKPRRTQAAIAPIAPIEEPRRAPLRASAVAAAMAPARPQPAGARADAVALARWLRPQTLQQQFILTELFQPPLALRDPERRL